jgi:hypothetical protein
MAGNDSTSGQNSGKLLILGILTVALLLAGTSWWFRYRATHRAAQFWGPEAARLIRDAPGVMLVKLNSPAPGGEEGDDRANLYDVSQAPGMVHLRNALVEDRSFDWPSSNSGPPPNDDFAQHWGLSFDDPDTREHLLIAFSADCRLAAAAAKEKTPHAISTAPIAAGLREMFEEMSRGEAEATR